MGDAQSLYVKTVELAILTHLTILTFAAFSLLTLSIIDIVIDISDCVKSCVVPNKVVRLEPTTSRS